MFETSAIGVSLFVVGWLYLVFIAPKVLALRRKGNQLVEDFEATDHLHRVVLGEHPKGPLANWKSLSALHPDILDRVQPHEAPDRPTHLSSLAPLDALTIRADHPVINCDEFSQSSETITDEMLETPDSALIEVLVRPGRRTRRR